MTKVLAWTVGVLAVVAVATGVYASFRYRPDATGFGLGVQRLHAWSAVALAVVLVVGLATFVWARRPDRRHGLPAFALVALLAVVLAVETSIGWALAWDQVALWAVTPAFSGIEGVWLGGHPVRFLIVDAAEVGVDEYRRTVWTHVVVLPVVVVLGAGLVVWWVARFARPGARPPTGDALAEGDEARP